MAKQLTTESRNKLKKLIPMLASDQNGEVIAAVGAIRRTLQSNGSDLHDLAAKLSKKQRETVALAVVPGITINNKPATPDKIIQLVAEFNQLKKENKNLKAKIEELENEDESEGLEIKELKIKSLGHKIVEEAFERMGSIIVLLFVLWLFIR